MWNFRGRRISDSGEQILVAGRIVPDMYPAWQIKPDIRPAPHTYTGRSRIILFTKQSFVPNCVANQENGNEEEIFIFTYL